MIVLTKKKLVYMLGIVIMIVFTYLIASNNIVKKNDEINYIATTALPVNKKVVILDAGHGKPDERR